MKNLILFKISIAIFLLGIFSSCKKFIDIVPKGKIILQNTNDYDLWLNNQTLTVTGSTELNNMSDVYDIPYLSNTNDVTLNSDRLSYVWADQLVIKNIAETTPPIWARHYSKIFLFNTVIYEIDKAQNGTQADKDRIKAEALLGRAFEYFYLINLYAKSYNANTADKDLGVPIVESTNVNDVVPPRATVKTVHDYIINDLNQAIPNLPDDNSKNRFRGSKASAYSVLARVYLYMGNYTDAAIAADKALTSSGSIVINYNDFATPSAYPKIANGKTDIYSRYSSYPRDNPFVSLDFINSMKRNDLRYLNFYQISGTRNAVSKDSTVYRVRNKIYYASGGINSGTYLPNFGTTAIEMKFILAEAAARKGDLTTALNILNNDIKKNRYKADSFTPFVSTVKEDVINEIFFERKVEFPLVGLRWFDMKRLDQEGKMTAVKRYYADNRTVIATLEPKSSKYVLKIPQVVINFNPTMPQN